MRSLFTIKHFGWASAAKYRSLTNQNRANSALGVCFAIAITKEPCGAILVIVEASTLLYFTNSLTTPRFVGQSNMIRLLFSVRLIFWSSAVVVALIGIRKIYVRLLE